MILLDTHVLVWLQQEPRKLSRAAEAAIRRSRVSNNLAASVATLVELAGMLGSGRIRTTGTIEGTIRNYIAGLTILPISVEIATLTAYFPPDFPSDPMDRIIAATARAEGLALVTADERIQRCALVKTIW